MSVGMIGFAALAATLFAGLYWVGLQVRAFGKWAMREEAPRERRWVFAAAAAIMGFVIGAMAYEPFLLGQQCHDAGQPLGSCMIQTSLAKK